MVRSKTFNFTVLLLGIVSLLGLPCYAQLTEEADDSDSSSGITLEGRVEKREQSVNLTGSLADADEKQMSIEWDRWRNRFARAVWKKTNQKLAGGDALMIGRFYLKYGLNPIQHFEKDVRAEVSCDITRDGTVENVRLLNSNGDQRFADLVVDSFKELNHKSFLEFPAGSQRERVTMTMGMKIGNGKFHERKFDDIERVKVSAEPERRSPQ